jgi:hypothetical protein
MLSPNPDAEKQHRVSDPAARNRLHEETAVEEPLDEQME